MNDLLNELGQPIGFPVGDWKGAVAPSPVSLQGRYCSVETVSDDRYCSDLFAAYAADKTGRNWTYLPYGPFRFEQDFRLWFDAACLEQDPMFHAIVDLQTGRAVGLASYLRINPDAGSIEVGHIHFSPLIQQRAIATEAMYLMMRQVFERLNYRRYEWKCDALNLPSRQAALRLGFQYEGIFRQAVTYKGRNRDTAWYSVLDKEWPALSSSFEQWLHTDNFDQNGLQRESLSTFR